MNFKVARILAIVLFAASIFSAMAMYLVPQEWAIPLVCLFLVLAMAAIVILLAFYRCPYCGGRFPVGKGIRSETCPHCGKDLGTTI